MSKLWDRRTFLTLGLAGAGMTGAVLGGARLLKAGAPVDIPSVPEDHLGALSPLKILRDFDYGTVKQENGRTVREFRITAGTSELQLNSAVSFTAWNFNGRVPGPTLRVNEGDRVRVIFLNRGGHAHSMHFHGTHAASVDGIRPIRNGAATIYEFDAEPFGVHLYHCHVAPVSRHIGKGLYGMFIIDPPAGRPPADEMLLIMAGYDLNDDGKNELYAFNGLPNYYRDHPILIRQDQLIRLYVLNVTEYEAPLTFHLHANMFRVFPTGRTLTPTLETDVVTMGMTERNILEFSYQYPGMYMFHPHQDPIAEAGCMGHFMVLAPAETSGAMRMG
ncbi:multicopper oxidase domain-containing protein [Anthocerotibacter panamensis]|uniref:multicopper oxidase domain-containing protein n=1 Tax=Anthocerotibacter panamensis TaxID=2857077 RepID=UPI001FD8B548|nr:multicopper oxidase domain-containing protein [Anthocerotibacter panamensis]